MFEPINWDSLLFFFPLLLLLHNFPLFCFCLVHHKVSEITVSVYIQYSDMVFAVVRLVVMVGVVVVTFYYVHNGFLNTGIKACCS